MPSCSFRCSAISSSQCDQIFAGRRHDRGRRAIIAHEEVVIAVADRGIGIPAGDLDRLFERYHRGSNVSGIVGTGVGLYLVKMVVDLHGGRIEVTSAEGEGSRFTVRLPLKPADTMKVVPSAKSSVAQDVQVAVAVDDGVASTDTGRARQR